MVYGGLTGETVSLPMDSSKFEGLLKQLVADSVRPDASSRLGSFGLVEREVVWGRLGTEAPVERRSWISRRWCRCRTRLWPTCWSRSRRRATEGPAELGVGCQKIV